MNKELKPSSNVDLSAQTVPMALSQVGDRNIQVAHANTVNHAVNIFPPNSLCSNNGGVVRFTLSTEYYNLFVIGEEAFDGAHFTIEKERALTIAEGIAPEISAMFACLNEEAILRIRSFPSLFASENHLYGRTDTDHLAYYGFVTDIKVQENGIKIYFQKYLPLLQQSINENAAKFAIKGNLGFNELNRTHWAIKRVNLLEELRDAGLVPAGC